MLMRGVFSNANDIYLLLMIFLRVSLYWKLLPVRYLKYEYGPQQSLQPTLNNVNNIQFI